MLPVIQLGPLSLPVSPFSLLLAFWLGASLAEKLAPRRAVSVDQLYALIFSGLGAGLIGARLGFVFQYPSAFLQSPAGLFSLNPGLLDPFSGFAFGLLGMFIYVQRVRWSALAALDALTPLLAVMALGLAVSHIASGAAFGAETSLPSGLFLWGAKRHPTQFYELAAAGLILGLLLLRFKPASQPGLFFLTFAALSAAAHLFLEAFRGDSILVWAGLRGGQIVAWLALAGALLLIEILHQKRSA